MSFEKYQKFCARIAKEYGFELEIDPFAKYPNELNCEYKYRLCIENRWPNKFPETKVCFLVKWYKPSKEKFTGFTFDFDWRYQLTEEELRKNIEQIIERENLK